MQASFHILSSKLMHIMILRRTVIQKLISDTGLYMGQFPVLDFIDHIPGCSQTEIAEKLQVTPASIALSTKRLQKAGLIKKIVDEKNLRCNKLFITEEGKALKDKCGLTFKALEEKMFSDFSESDVAAFSEYLDRIISNISGEENKNLDFYSIIALKNKLDKNKK